MAINKKDARFLQTPGLNIAPTEIGILRGIGLSITLTEVRFVGLVTLLLLMVTSIPYVYGYLTAPPNKWFSGIVENVHDTAQYLSWMRESGQYLFIENKLTSEPNEAIFLNLHWWIPGRLAALFGLSLLQVYQVFRVFAVPFFTIVTYAFCALLFEDLNKRKFAFLLTLLTSGLGWIWVVAKQFTGELEFPLDVQTSLGNSFYTMLSSPHLTFAVALTLLVLFLALQGIRQKRISFSLSAGFLTLFLGMGHVYDVVTVWAVLGVFGLLLTLRSGWSWRVFWNLFLVVLIAAPSVLYLGWVSSDFNPLWKQALAQYDNLGVFTPDPIHLIILLGLSFIIALTTFSGVVPLDRQTDLQLFMKGWFGITLLLIYLPLPFRIMLLTGYQVPLAVLATWGLFDHIFPWLQERLKDRPWGQWISEKRLAYWLPVLFFILVLPTNLYLLGWKMVVLRRHDYPYYLYQDDVKAMSWLDENTNPDDVVLSSFTTGHYLPGLTGKKTFLSNAVMTMDFIHKRELVTAFFSLALSDEERATFLRKYQIRYVFYGPAERLLGAYDPEQSPLFEQVFSTPETKVYQVVN